MNNPNEYMLLGEDRLREAREGIEALGDESLAELDTDQKRTEFLELSVVQKLQYLENSKYEISVMGSDNRVMLARKLSPNSTTEYFSSLSNLLEVPESFRPSVYSCTGTKISIVSNGYGSYELVVTIPGKSSEQAIAGQGKLDAYVDQFNCYAQNTNQLIVKELMPFLKRRYESAKASQQERKAVVEELKQTGFVVKEYK